MEKPKLTKGCKRLCALLPAIALLLGGLCAAVRTEQVQVPRYLGQYDADPTALEIQARLYDGIWSRQESIDLSDVAVPVTQFKGIWDDFRRTTPDAYIVGSNYSYSFKTVNGIRYVTKYWPKYTMTQDEQAHAQLVWADTMQSILAGVNPNWNSMQTALYLHDYLVLHTCYDNSYSYYDAYSLLTCGTGVCMAYTLAYDALLEAVGIRNDYTSSAEMNHIWNKVYIGGSPFNVDVTWDDPNPDRLGQVDHSHFLVSDSVLDDNHQYTWEEGYGQCADPFYDDAFWQNVHTAIVPMGDEFFFISNGTIYKWTTDNTLKKCVTLSSKWYTDSKRNSWWYNTNPDGSKYTNYSVFWPAGDKILYNATSSIKTFDPKTNKLATVYTYTGYGNIWGFSYDGSSMTLQVGYHPSGPFEYVTVTDFKIP